MEKHHTFNELLAQAAREMGEAQGTVDTLERAVLMAVDAIGPCDSAGISLKVAGAIQTPAASSEELRKLDQLQYEMREGPCWDALHQQEAVTSVDLASDSRWPQWGPRVAEELGLRSSMSFRLFATGKDLGALNLFSHQPNAFSGDDLTDGLALSAHTAVALARSMEEVQFIEALDTRTLIGQATGILMERFGLEHDAAFGVLVRVSQRTNTKIRTLAAELVETGQMEGFNR